MIDHLTTINKSISKLEKVVAMCTHHDIITGTCLQNYFFNINIYFSKEICNQLLWKITKRYLKFMLIIIRITSCFGGIQILFKKQRK